MRAVVDDLGSAVKCLDDAEQLTRTAATLLDRVSGGLADEAQAAGKLLEDTLQRTRKALAALERV